MSTGRDVPVNPTDPTWMHCDCEHCKGRRAFETTKGITREMAITALVNLHHSIRGEDCPREVAIGCATSAVQQLKRERDELRVLLKDGFAYVRDANRLMAADGDLDEDDEDGANEWMERAAAALVGDSQ